MKGRTTEELVDTLAEYARSGCLEASRFLSEAYGDGRLEPTGRDDAYKYRCLRCLQGDYEECWRLYSEGRRVSHEAAHGPGDVDVHYYEATGWEKIGDGEFRVELEAKERNQWDLDGVEPQCRLSLYTDDPLNLMMGLNRGETERRLRELAANGDSRAAYDLRVKGLDADGLGELADRDPRAVRDSLTGMLDACPYGQELWFDCLFHVSEDADPAGAVALMESVRHAIPRYGFILAVWMYCGRHLPRDESSALVYALESAEDGFGEAADLVSCMVGHIHETDSLRLPGMTGEELEEHLASLKKVMNEYGQMCAAQRPYGCPSRESLQDGIEWRLIINLTDSDCYAFTESDDANDSGGYEDDVISMRPFDWGYDEDPERASRPNFLFKPSGFNMEWYKYPWRSAEMSENLSIGEIRRIWRLCIDHLLHGRELPSGTTSELLAQEPAAVPVPEGLEKRVEAVCGMADKRERERIGNVMHCFRASHYMDTYDPTDGAEVRNLIKELEARLRK